MMNREVMKSKYLVAGITSLILLVLLLSPVNAAVYLKDGTEISQDNASEVILKDPNTTAENFTITFFYDTHCGACEKAQEFLDQYRTDNPDVDIEYHDIFNNTENRALFEEFKTSYNQEYTSVPVVFIGNAVLEGDQAIEDNFKPIADWFNEQKQ
ncbi:MAG: glutaredoxin family protein [Methanospirillum sp.]|nr:glutaredoxin family protein [Methanospirillum sp.]